MKILSNHDLSIFNYFIKYLSHKIQKPGKLIGIAIGLISNQGGGKNLLLEHLYI